MAAKRTYCDGGACCKVMLLQVEELARVITNLCAIVPGGIVCFFPSYDYENMVCTKWEKTGVLDKIRKKKQVVCVCVCVCVRARARGACMYRH